MNYLIVVFLTGFTLASLLFYRMSLNMFFFHALWAQLGIIVMYSYSFIKKPKQETPRNIPLACLITWICFQTALTLIPFLPHGTELKVRLLTQPLLHTWSFLLAVMFYRIVTQYKDERTLDWCIWGLKVAIAVNLVMAILQYFNLSQIFMMFSPDDQYNNGRVGGFLGNGTHISAWFGAVMPAFLYKFKKTNALWIGLMLLVMTQTGHRMNDPAISGFIIMGILSICYGLRYSWKKTALICVVCAGIALGIYSYMTPETQQNFLSHNGRLNYWVYYWNVFKNSTNIYNGPLFGYGLGIILSTSFKTPFPLIRHLHFELYQIMFELGIVGLGLSLWLIWDYFKKTTCFHLKMLFLGFVLSSCFVFSAHIWFSASWAIMFYALGRKE